MSGSPLLELTAGSIWDPPPTEGSASPFLTEALSGPLQSASRAGVVGEPSGAPPALLPFLLSLPEASAAAELVRSAGFPAGLAEAEQREPAEKEGGQTVEGPGGVARQLPLLPPSAA